MTAFSNFNLTADTRYEGSIAELRGGSVIGISECRCHRCFYASDVYAITVLAPAGGAARLEHVRSSSIVG